MKTLKDIDLIEYDRTIEFIGELEDVANEWIKKLEQVDDHYHNNKKPDEMNKYFQFADGELEHFREVINWIKQFFNLEVVKK